MPVSSYLPEYIELFRTAAQREVRITLPSEKKAMRMRFQLNNLRKELRKEQHGMASVSNGVQLTIEDNVLIAKPSDDEFLAPLQEAGITIDDPAQRSSPEDKQEPKSVDHSDFMQSFKEGTS